NIMRLKNKRAGKVSRKRLKVARGYLKKNNKEKFYDEILNAIWGYFADKLSIPLADLSRETALSNEKVKNLDEDLLKNLNEIIDTCEMARYAPSSIHISMDDLYKKTSKVINKIDQKIK
ncbi:MAG: protein BatD, partial [Chlorobi bacterium]|nr:protein BatD [Chlorobiota bacterium]